MRQNDALRSADADRDFNCEQQNNEMSLSVDSIHSNVYIGTGLASTYRRWGVVIGNWGGSRNQAVEGPLEVRWKQKKCWRCTYHTPRDLVTGEFCSWVCHWLRGHSDSGELWTSAVNEAVEDNTH